MADPTVVALIAFGSLVLNAIQAIAMAWIAARYGLAAAAATTRSSTSSSRESSTPSRSTTTTHDDTGGAG